MRLVKPINIISLVFLALVLEAAEVQVIAPGWGELDFTAPQAGSYSLPVLWEASDGEIILADKKEADLINLYGDKKISILSFIYTSCNDVNGCPLSTFVLHSIKNRLRDNPDLAEQVRMISLSFDPINDTPQVMRNYGKDFAGSGVEWLFATTKSERRLRPILDAYGQYVLRFEDEKDKSKSSFAHMLRVYLIDKKKDIRNVYSVDFLHPDVLLADIKTLLMEEGVL